MDGDDEQLSGRCSTCPTRPSRRTRAGSSAAGPRPGSTSPRRPPRRSGEIAPGASRLLDRLAREHPPSSTRWAGTRRRPAAPVRGGASHHRGQWDRPRGGPAAPRPRPPARRYAAVGLLKLNRAAPALPLRRDRPADRAARTTARHWRGWTPSAPIRWWCGDRRRDGTARGRPRTTWPTPCAGTAAGPRRWTGDRRPGRGRRRRAGRPPDAQAAAELSLAGATPSQPVLRGFRGPSPALELVDRTGWADAGARGARISAMSTGDRRLTEACAARPTGVGHHARGQDLLGEATTLLSVAMVECAEGADRTLRHHSAQAARLFHAGTHVAAEGSAPSNLASTRRVRRDAWTRRSSICVRHWRSAGARELGGTRCRYSARRRRSIGRRSTGAGGEHRGRRAGAGRETARRYDPAPGQHPGTILHESGQYGRPLTGTVPGLELARRMDARGRSWRR